MYLIDGCAGLVRDWVDVFWRSEERRVGKECSLSCCYMSWSVSSLLFSIVHMVVPSGLCSVVCVFCVGVVLARIVGLGVCLGPV